MKTGIQDWLENDARPADLYELLGRERFDPDRQGLLAAVRAAYAELHPFENHKDPKVAGRAVELLGELGRAEDLLSDSEKLRAYHESILEELHEVYAQARGEETAGHWSPVRLRTWLQKRRIHAERLEAIARALSAPGDETLDLGFYETQPVEPIVEEEPTEGFLLQEPEPIEKQPVPTLEPLDKPPPHTPPWRSKRGPQGAFAKLAGGTRRWQLVLALAVAGLGWVLFLFAVWVMVAVPDEWQGQLTQIRGHDGEIHLVIRLEPPSSAGQAPFVEAIVQDDRFGREISDYRSDEDTTTGGDGVVVEGRRCKPDRARFRLMEPPQATLVELAAIRKVDDARSRAVVGLQRSRASFDFDKRPGVLARLIRIHPQPGETIGFAARYGGFGQRGVELHPSQTDRRSVWMEFPGASEDDFSLYRPGDQVYAVATLSPKSSPDSLTLTGISIRRLEEPNSPVSAISR